MGRVKGEEHRLVKAHAGRLEFGSQIDLNAIDQYFPGRLRDNDPVSSDHIQQDEFSHFLSQPRHDSKVGLRVESNHKHIPGSTAGGTRQGLEVKLRADFGHPFHLSYPVNVLRWHPCL